LGACVVALGHAIPHPAPAPHTLQGETLDDQINRRTDDRLGGEILFL
jgi:hypothetical protein